MYKCNILIVYLNNFYDAHAQIGKLEMLEELVLSENRLEELPGGNGTFVSLAVHCKHGIAHQAGV